MWALTAHNHRDHADSGTLRLLARALGVGAKIAVDANKESR